MAFCHPISLHCLISYREGLGTSLLITGLATIDPNSQEEHTKIHKIPKFGVNQASFDTKLGDFVNLGVLFRTMWINSC